MLVLGLDPGTATTGYGLVKEHEDGTMEAIDFGVITTKANTPMPVRLKQIYDELTAIIDKYQPDAVAIEELFFGKNVTTGITVAQARGVMLLVTAQKGLPVTTYKPKVAKQAITGYGSADKTQMQEMMRQILGLDEVPRPDDAADGLAMAYTHLNSTRFDRMQY
ncbi:MAG: crossover junction endodeoxyribonuclease RuvC [Chloroflexi bacterium]|nr:crossover junction endodeoxyribonuclease RuvC [Chloroflexota bacterium]